jgi:hypothetical protein
MRVALASGLGDEELHLVRLLARTPRQGAKDALKKKEQRGETEQDDQRQPSHEQPLRNFTGARQKSQTHESDQREAATFDQPVPRIAFELTPEEEAVKEKSQRTFYEGAGVVAICRDRHGENVSSRCRPGFVAIPNHFVARIPASTTAFSKPQFSKRRTRSAERGWPAGAPA